MQVSWFSWMSKVITAWTRYHQARTIPTSLAIRVPDKISISSTIFFSKKNTAAATKGKMPCHLSKKQMPSFKEL